MAGYCAHRADYLGHGVSGSRTQIEDSVHALFCPVERHEVGAPQVLDVEVIAHRGAIGSGVIVTENLYFGALSRGNGQHIDRKSTRLNSSHVAISYAVFCSQ